jgi:hypothetical protein
MNLTQLNNSGILEVDNVNCADDLIQIGNELGFLLPGPNGEIVKKIIRKTKDQSLLGTQSSIYGRGSFPLHTDTVFWPKPAKYAIFYAYGDVRRSTTYLRLSDLINSNYDSFVKLANKSVWYVGPPKKRFYCSMTFVEHDEVNWRYDSDLMKPANQAAIEVNDYLRPLVFSKNVKHIKWTGHNAFIFSNWNVLHGRADEPENENDRTILRLYVR